MTGINLRKECPQAAARAAAGERTIVSPQNERIKNVVKLRARRGREQQGLLIVEGGRELKRALESQRWPVVLFYCREFFAGKNELELINQCRRGGAEIISCAPPAFSKMAYREKPEGLLALIPQLKFSLADLALSPRPLLVVAEALEKPGNLGTILRSADAAGAEAVIVCDRNTDINNPNVVRASVGAIFTVPVVEAAAAAVLPWLRAKKIQVLAASPRAAREYTQADFRRGTAIVVGAEQAGLSEFWMQAADLQVRIPMRGRIDSLNVAAATTILLFEAVRQRQGNK